MEAAIASSRTDGDVPAGSLMLARRHLVSYPLVPAFMLAQPGGRSAREVSGAASTAHVPSSWRLGVLPSRLGIGAMELAAPSCCRLGLLLVVISSSSLALSISLGPSAGRSTQATSRVSHPLVCLAQPGVGVRLERWFNAASCWRRRRPCSQAPSNRPTASSCGEIGDSAGLGGDPTRRATPRRSDRDS